MRHLDRLLAERRLIVCVGPGGVGKTTTSAALGLRAAKLGRRVLVLTVDPARRLADALSIPLDDQASRLILDDSFSGAMSAAMLDTQSSWDSMIHRAAQDAEVEQHVYDNRVYRAFSRTLARSHAYIAMDRLVDAMQSEQWDLVILDTPPMRSALDLLDAPSSLAAFVDEQVVSFFLGASESFSPPRFAVRVLGWVMGRGLAEELIDFFKVVSPLRDRLASSAREAQTTLRAASTAFVLVVAPSSAHLEDASFLRDDLLAREIALSAVVVNRGFLPDTSQARWSLDRARAAMASAPGGSTDEAERVLVALLEARRTWLAEAMRIDAAIDRFLSAMPESPAWLLPRYESEPCSVAKLLELIADAREFMA